MNYPHQIKAIIGLGNPGPVHFYQRHNIGFRIVDALATAHGAHWQTKNNACVASVMLGNHSVLLIKPQTYMNTSGAVVPALLKQGIKAENILVVHDELEKPFDTVTLKHDGSHKGHNGLKSIIAACGPQFLRLRFGIGRPERKEDVPTYVLQPFKEDKAHVEQCIERAVNLIESLFTSSV